MIGQIAQSKSHCFTCSAPSSEVQVNTCGSWPVLERKTAHCTWRCRRVLPIRLIVNVLFAFHIGSDTRACGLETAQFTVTGASCSRRDVVALRRSPSKPVISCALAQIFHPVDRVPPMFERVGMHAGCVCADCARGLCVQCLSPNRQVIKV